MTNETREFEVTLTFPEAPARKYTTTADSFEFHAEIRSELTAAYGDDLPVYQIRAIR